MLRKIIIIQSIFLSILFSNCNEGFLEIDDNCYWTLDLIVLQKIILNSELSIAPLELGVQEWENGRLVSLCSSIYSINGCQQDYQLSGNIPNEIHFLDHLRSLILIGNNLSGEIPVNIGQLSNLEYLDLSYNNFEGVIPFEFGNLSKLTDLYISNNNISGLIPEALCNLSLLKNFYAFSNQITGNLPECIGSLSELSILVLFDNEINGNIPYSIGSLSKLTYIDLSSNQLVSLPESIGEMPSLNYIHLNNNNLINLPESICDLEINWNFPSVSSIYNNYLCELGYYPECLEEFLGDQVCDWYLIGDTNLNGEVNILDVVRLVAIILFIDDINEFQFVVSDTFVDSSLDILDIIVLIDIVLD